MLLGAAARLGVPGAGRPPGLLQLWKGWRPPRTHLSTRPVSESGTAPGVGLGLEKQNGTELLPSLAVQTRGCLSDTFVLAFSVGVLQWNVPDMSRLFHGEDAFLKGPLLLCGPFLSSRAGLVPAGWSSTGLA